MGKCIVELMHYHDILCKSVIVHLNSALVGCNSQSAVHTSTLLLDA